MSNLIINLKNYIYIYVFLSSEDGEKEEEKEESCPSLSFLLFCPRAPLAGKMTHYSRNKGRRVYRRSSRPTNMYDSLYVPM